MKRTRKAIKCRTKVTGYAASTFRRGLCEQGQVTRPTGGPWQSIPGCQSWAVLGRTISHERDGSVSPEELRVVIGVTRSSEDEKQAWEAARVHWQAALASDLEQRILSHPDNDSLRATLIFCALMASSADACSLP